MSLITLQDICMHVGHRLLLEQVNLTVTPGERVCLVGRNGVGKSTLMRIIAGRVTPDSGTVIRSQDLVVSHLEQGVPDDLCGSVFDPGPSGTGQLA